jgi:hypothetical protein
MNIKKDGKNYKAESGSRKGKWYKVDIKKPWCDCAHFRFREMKRRGVCKHIKAVREYVEKTQQKTLANEQKEMESVTAFIEKKGGEVDSLVLIEKFGEEKVNSLIQLGELIERQGKIKILK